MSTKYISDQNSIRFTFICIHMHMHNHVIVKSKDNFTMVTCILNYAFIQVSIVLFTLAYIICEVIDSPISQLHVHSS